MGKDHFNEWLMRSDREALVMGVLNVTPDSFSDGALFIDPARAIEQARQMVDAGAGWIDVGGESTRPGSQPVEAKEQIRRVVPVIEGIAREKLSAQISIDTTSAEVARAALDAGATIVNDISAGRFDDAMLPLIAKRQAAVVLMHMQGMPADMQRDPRYTDVVSEVISFLKDRCEAAIKAGVARENILVDPGIGFGKTIDHNLKLLQQTRSIADAVDRPVVVGPSRKAFIGAVTGEANASQRAFGTAACVAWCIANGASVVRVHDVGPMNQVVRMTRAITRGSIDDCTK